MADAEWPVLSNDALIGLAKDVVDVLDPTTEADPAAILFTFLSGVGCMVGPDSHFRLGGRAVPPRLNTVIVGDSGFARKGTAQSDVEQILRHVEPQFFDVNKVDGIASGPALAKFVKTLEIGSANSTHPDKRAWVVEEEFVNILRAPTGTNSLSAVLRKVFDSGSINNMTKKAPIMLRDAHVCVTGHITMEEFAAATPRVDKVNGFVNRFMFCCVKMSKVLPAGAARLAPSDLERLSTEVSDVISYAKRGHNIQMAVTAMHEFDDFRKEFISEWQNRRGEFAASVRRADVHVLRLAVLYALLDHKNIIEYPHMVAAMAVWDYAMQSARYVFNEMDDKADMRKLVAALSMAGPQGMRSKERCNLFGGNSERQREAEEKAIAAGHIIMVQVPTGRRPISMAYHADYASMINGTMEQSLEENAT